MMMKRSIWLLLAFVACAGPKTQEAPPPPPPQQQQQAAIQPPEPPKPPVAKKVPQVRKLHGDEFVDDYFWLREKGTPDVLAYLKDENDYATAMMKPYDNLAEDIFHTIVSHVAQNDETLPAKFGDY